MGLIRKQLNVAGSLGERKCTVLFDTGASASFVREDIAREVAQTLRAPKPLYFTLGNGAVIRAEYTTDLHIEIDGHTLAHMFLVFPGLPDELIIGADFLQRWKIRLDPATEEFIIDEEALKIVLI